MPASAWLCRYCDMTGTQGFTHWLQPLVRSQSQHVCFIHGSTLAGAKCTWAHKLFILHLQNTKSWKYCLAKNVFSPTKVPSSQLFCPKCSQNSSHLSGRSICSILNESWQKKLSFLRSFAVLSHNLRQAHCATTSLTILVYLSTIPLFCRFYAVLLVPYKCT